LENYKLLEIHRKKLSINFTLFIFILIWIIQAIFLFWLFINNNLNLEKKLKSKNEAVINILKNKEQYSQQIQDENNATKHILEKSLEWITIYENDIKILWDIKNNSLPNEKILNSSNYKYYQSKVDINFNNYHIIIKTENKDNYNSLITEYIYFLLLSLPFCVLLYYIWYIFIGRNFKPIKETLSSLETFSGNINHEMKTPLTEIISTLSLSQKIKWNYEQAIDQSLQSTKRLNKILDSMLWIINLVDSSYRKQKINLLLEINHLISENSITINDKNIKINTNFKQNSYSLNIDKEHFHICVWNILKNAIKYSHNNSQINIDFDNWIIVIKDNWVWIEKKNLKSIFDSYFRENYTTQEGYGLWLALVKKITDLNSWKISIVSEKNIGTVVTIEII